MTLASTIVFLVLSITSSVYCQSSVEAKEPLSTKEISALVPKRLMNYSVKGDPKASTLTVGRLTYSLCQRDFVSKHKHVQFLLFDYHGAEIMYTQAMRKWNEMAVVNNDSIYFQKSVDANNITFESYFPRTKHSQIVMGINNRFFLTVSGDKINLEELKAILTFFDFNKYPK